MIVWQSARGGRITGFPQTSKDLRRSLRKRHAASSTGSHWGWLLIFLVPLALSEYMFSMVGRTVNMILFPVVWTAFWIVIMQRFGWPILKKRKHK